MHHDRVSWLGNGDQKSVAKNIVNYTKQTKMFFANNSTYGYLLREGVIKIVGASDGIFNRRIYVRCHRRSSIGSNESKVLFYRRNTRHDKTGIKSHWGNQRRDQVLAYNDNLGIFDYKDVVEVYKNETTELCHIHTEKEEIVCTPNHSILTKEGWKEAKDLTTSDLIKTENGFEKVDFIEKEELGTSVAVYNFNVLGYHTYAVDENHFIVHNKCDGNIDDASEYKIANKGHTVRHQPKNVTEQMALNDAKSFPTTGKKLDLKLNDPRWSSANGWSKMQKMYYGNFGGKKGILRFIM